MVIFSEELGPVEGRSHFCEGRTLFGRKCHHVVSNDSDHCEAGHKNKIRAGDQAEPYGLVENDGSVIAISPETDSLADSISGERANAGFSAQQCAECGYVITGRPFRRTGRGEPLCSLRCSDCWWGGY
jgi:RNA polymerase subunit RPABC4/transcription elongation factor Spt4